MPFRQIALLAILLATSGEAVAQHTSIRINEATGSCEPSIAIDPNDPARIVAGMVLNDVSYSSDTGRTWHSDKLTSPYGVWGDPVVDVDNEGRFYYFHLSNPQEGSWIDRIVCQRSDDGGRSWDEGTFTGLNGDKAQDKHWSAIDHERNIIHLTWTEFDDYGSKDSTCMSRIRYAQSLDRGDTWSEPLTISERLGDCIDDDDTVEGAVPAVGPQGQVYVSWAGPHGLSFTQSDDQGQTWSQERTIVDIPDGWTYDIPGIYRANGLPITTCDRSTGPHRGNIYINWSDQRKGMDDTEVWIISSTDGGATWTAPQAVSQAQNASHQFFTWMAIDQITGDIYSVYYDRRDAQDPLATEVYMAVSCDGGKTFYDFPLEEDASFKPDDAVFFGDYNNLSVCGNVIRPIWTRMDDGLTSIYTSLVDPHHLDRGLRRIRIPIQANHQDHQVRLAVFKGCKEVSDLGTHSIPAGHTYLTAIWDARLLKPGVYTVKAIQGKEKIWTEKIEIHAPTDR